MPASIATEPLVFLDTSVVIGLLTGDDASERLLAVGRERGVRFAISPVVLAETLLLPEGRAHAERLEQLQADLAVLPDDFNRAQREFRKHPEMRNHVAHSNDFLILSSAADCDYLVTFDASLSGFPDGGPRIVTPQELLSELGAPA